MRLDDGIRGEQAAWAAPETQAYYRSHRNQPADLYESERFFLPQVLPQVSSALDVGCAAGGFCGIMRAYNPALRYVGVDITPELVALAQRDHPECEFHTTDGLSFPFDAGSFDLVYCSGVLHLNSHYREITRAMWEQTRRYLLFDLRLTRGAAVTGEMDVSLDAATRLGTRLPYNVLNLDATLDWLRTLSPAAIRARGYSHPPSASAHVSLERVLMVFFLLERGLGTTTAPALELRLDE